MLCRPCGPVSVVETPVFTTRVCPTVPCDTPVLTVNFPRCGCAGANAVVMANGAVVDLNQLGQIIGRSCPAVFNAPCQPETTQTGQVVIQQTATGGISGDIFVSAQVERNIQVL